MLLVLLELGGDLGRETMRGGKVVALLEQSLHGRNDVVVDNGTVTATLLLGETGTINIDHLLEQSALSGLTRAKEQQLVDL